MLENITGIISDELIVLFTAMLPLLELKGAIPLGVSLGMSPLHATILGIIGSTFPVPFILLLLRPILRLFYKTKIGTKIADWITAHILKKDSKVKKYRTWGLFLFVAIPLPTTGVWTGSGLAVLLDMKISHSMIAVFFGNCVAALIMMVLSGALWGII